MEIVTRALVPRHMEIIESENLQANLAFTRAI